MVYYGVIYFNETLSLVTLQHLQFVIKIVRWVNTKCYRIKGIEIIEGLYE